MKTTLNIDDQVMIDLKAEAARRGVTMSSLVEMSLRRTLEERPIQVALPPLPSFDGGGVRVDVSDRAALYDAMEGR